MYRKWAFAIIKKYSCGRQVIWNQDPIIFYPCVFPLLTCLPCHTSQLKTPMLKLRQLRVYPLNNKFFIPRPMLIFGDLFLLKKRTFSLSTEAEVHSQPEHIFIETSKWNAINLELFSGRTTANSLALYSPLWNHFINVRGL